ncbi:MAG: hypothetical protein N2246_07690 [Candidatus Sumerlaeia bacterium]|nr:hypothetical protein [Candidatus Sumerlaeia bacterium]
MIDPKLEKQLADIKELLALWRKYHEFFAIGVKGTDITPEKEQQFLELKSRIAMLHDTFMEAITHDQNIGQNVLSLVERAITLRHLSRLNVAEIKKMEIEWHEAYLLLNETVGILEERKEALSHISPSKYRLKHLLQGIFLNVSSFLGSIYFKMAAVVIIIILILWALPAFEIFDYSKLKEYRLTAPAYKAVAKAYRKMFNIVAPYDALSELQLNSSKREAHNVVFKTNPPIDKGQAAQQYARTDVYADLRSAVEYKAEEYQYGSDPIRLYYFMFKTIAEAENVVKRFNEWKKNHQDELVYYPIPAMTTSVNKLNVVIFLVTMNEMARNYFKTEELGILE